MQLQYNKEYFIHKLTDLNKYDINSKVKEYLSNNIMDLFNTNPNNKISISLQGSEHNFNVMKKTYEDLDKEHNKQEKFIEQLFNNEKITYEDFLIRKEKLKKLQKESKKNIENVIEEYKEWHEKFNNYDVILINLYS